MRTFLPFGLLLLTTACSGDSQGSDEVCTAEVSSGAWSSCSLADGDPCACDLEISDCSSGATYRIDCEETGSGLLTCDCFLDDVLQDSFELDAVCEQDPPEGDDWVASMNTGCGWDIALPED